MAVSRCKIIELPQLVPYAGGKLLILLGVTYVHTFCPADRFIVSHFLSGVNM